MKCIKGLFCFLFVFFIVCCSVETNIKTAIDKNSDPFIKFYKSVVRLEVENTKNGHTYVATGFAIDNHHLLTAGHYCSVVFDIISEDSNSRITMVFINDDLMLEAHLGRPIIKAVAANQDICLLYLQNHFIPPLTFAKRSPKIFDFVKMIGSPMGIYPVVSDGRVVISESASKDDEVFDKLIVSLPGTTGNSGGPVINNDGLVIGLISSKMKTYDYLMSAVPVKQILKFVDDVNKNE